MSNRLADDAAEFLTSYSNTSTQKYAGILISSVNLVLKARTRMRAVSTYMLPVSKYRRQQPISRRSADQVEVKGQL
jgi:hypothetical protein